MRLRKNQSGFSAVEIGLVVLVIGLIAAVAWLVYDRQKGENSQTQNSSVITNFDECVAAGNPVMESFPEQCSANGQTFTKAGESSSGASEDADWLTFVPRNNRFTIKLADGWVVEESYDGLGIHTFDNDALALQPGTKAAVKPFPGGRDGSSGLFLNYSETADFHLLAGSVKQGSTKTADGLEVERYEYVEQANVEAAIGGLAKGGKQYTYVVRNGKEAVSLSYSINPGQTDHSETVEKVIRTLHFN